MCPCLQQKTDHVVAPPNNECMASSKLLVFFFPFYFARATCSCFQRCRNFEVRGAQSSFRTHVTSSTAARPFTCLLLARDHHRRHPLQLRCCFARFNVIHRANQALNIMPDRPAKRSPQRKWKKHEDARSESTGRKEMRDTRKKAWK